jgi:hypothetical protein
MRRIVKPANLGIQPCPRPAMQAKHRHAISSSALFEIQVMAVGQDHPARLPRLLRVIKIWHFGRP